MRDDMKFALVLHMGNTGKERFPFDYGVCVIDGETSVTSFSDLLGLAGIIGTIPCIPSVFGQVPGKVSFEAEQAAIEALVTASNEFRSKYSHGRPAGYESLRTLIEGGVIATVREGRIGIDLADWVAKGAGWHEGDRIEMTAKADGSAIALHADRDGFPLAEGARNGWLAASRDWPLPIGVVIPDGEYSVPFAIEAEGVFMAMPQPETLAPDIVPLGLEPANPPVRRASPLSLTLPFDYRWSLVSLAAVYGLLSISLKFI